MNRDMNTQVREYTEFFQDGIDPVEMEEILRQLVGDVPVRPDGPVRSAHRRGWATAAVAALVTVIVLGSVAWFSRWNGEAPPVSETPPTTTAADETPPTTVVVVGETFTVTWSRAQWIPTAHEIVAISSGFLGTDAARHLWHSTDGATWERILPELDDITVASTGSTALVSGLRNGEVVLLSSIDGIDWTEIDRSVVPFDRGQAVIATWSSGLAWFDPGTGDREGVLAVIKGDRITGVYDLPPDSEVVGGLSDVVGVGGNVAAYSVTMQSPGSNYAWEYLGDGAWSDTMGMTMTSDLAAVGDTVLIFDHTNATCCLHPIPGTSLWPLLSSNDGINWTEVAQIAGQDVHALHVNAGSSFWIYGPSIGGGGTSIEFNSDTTLGISADGLVWHDIDLSQISDGFAINSDPPVSGFVHVAGDTIFLSSNRGNQYWIGVVNTE